MILVRELLDALEESSHLFCVLTVESVEEKLPRGRMRVVLTVAFQDCEASGLASVNLLHELQYLQALGQLRALSEHFGIPSEKLEALLPPKE